MERQLLIGSVLFGLAVLGLAGLFYVNAGVSGSLETRKAKYIDALQLTVAAEDIAQHRAVFSSTVAERAAIDQLTKAQVLQMVGAIDTAGKDAGVMLTVSAASKEATTGALLQPVDFILEASGDFGRLMRAFELLEQLPIPSHLMQTSISMQGEKTKTTSEVWRASMRLRVYSAAQL